MLGRESNNRRRNPPAVPQHDIQGFVSDLRNSDDPAVWVASVQALRKLLSIG
jgi:hypothetical protein